MYYFAYGMNTNLIEMASRCPSAKIIGPATLKDHKFTFSYHADIHSEDNSVVHGALWLITKDCLQSLDLLEGYPRYYNRKIVEVTCKDHRYFSWVYYMSRRGMNELPSKTYWDCLIEGYEKNNIPTDQLFQAINSNLTENTKSDILYK
jgi:gamma-glutamylcyclotransferase (GGCT)/AIG2-like uncharacterized protein YtfP